jgi:general secretion pathway protein K
MRANEHRRGIVLVTVLWAIVLLSALAMAAATTFRGYAGVMAVERDAVRAQGLIDAGLEVAAGIAWTSDRPMQDFRTTLALPAGSVALRLDDEGGLIDLNKAPAPVLSGLLRSVGAAQPDALAQRIVDQRRPPEEAAPAATSAAKDHPEQREDAPFTDVRQLARIPGMRPEWIAALRPLVTVFGDRTINPLTAPPAVLAALPGVDPARLDAFLDTRRRYPTDAKRLAGLLGAAVEDYLGGRTQQTLSVRIRATLPDGYGAGAHAVIVLLSGDREPYRVLAWDGAPASADETGSRP